MASAPGAAPDQTGTPPLYILITQCLQNDFFLNPQCRLSLPDTAVSKLLLSPDGPDRLPVAGPRRRLPQDEVDRSPLATFLDGTVGTRLRGHGDGLLHVINIRDWHEQGETYERERRQYGAHCEAGSWGSAFIDGLAPLLDPAAHGTTPDERGLQVHDIRSNSLFDFQHSVGGRAVPYETSRLTLLLDALLSDGRHETAHVAVIGILTDIKVQLLLTELRSRYDVRHLVVSDTLTASRTLDRHLSALDFCERVLQVEVMGGLTELASFLGSRPDDRALPSGGTADAPDYAAYFQDRQGILSYEDARLREYRLQTSQRLNQAQRTVAFASRFLIAVGVLLLLAAVTFSLVATVVPERVGWQVPAVFGVLGAGQIISLFFIRPLRSLQDALAEETIYRMVLESRSLKVALARFHVTATDSLHRHPGAGLQLDAFERQLSLLERIDAADFDRLKSLSLRLPGGAPPSDQGPSAQ